MAFNLETAITDVEDAVDALNTLLGVAEKYDGFLSTQEQVVITDVEKGAQWFLNLLHSLPH